MLRGIDWTGEFEGVNLGDKRLKKRLFRIMDAFAEAPEESVFAAAGNRSQAKAIYRFLNNDAVKFDGLLDSISKATVARMQRAECERVLLLQDTTAVSYGHRTGIEGMGYYCDSKQKGMLVHSCLAVTDNGVPLGLTDQRDWTRQSLKNDTGTKEARKLRPIDEKESGRWVDVIRAAHDRVPSDVPTLTVCDREGDFYELFAEAEKTGEKFLVRLVQNRLTSDGKRLFDMLKETSPMGETTVHVGRDPRKNMPPREAQAAFCYLTVNIRKPARRKESHLPEMLTLTAIYVRETDPPKGEKPAHWFLMTNLPVETAEDVVKIIGYYAQRWKIERFHFTLKSGCGIEELQSHSYEKLKILILLYSVVAIQLLNLLYMSRICPEASADMFLEPVEQQTLCRAARKTKDMPSRPYTLKDIIQDLAALAGRKGAPSDGPPGVKTLWKGLQKLYVLLTYQEFLL